MFYFHFTTSPPGTGVATHGSFSQSSTRSVLTLPITQVTVKHTNYEQLSQQTHTQAVLVIRSVPGTLIPCLTTQSTVKHLLNKLNKMTEIPLCDIMFFFSGDNVTFICLSFHETELTDTAAFRD